MLVSQEIKTALEKKFPAVLKNKIVTADNNYIWAEPVSPDSFQEIIDFAVAYLGFDKLHMMTEDRCHGSAIIIYALSDSDDNMLILKQTTFAATPLMYSVSSLFGNTESCEKAIAARSDIQFNKTHTYAEIQEIIDNASEQVIFDTACLGHTYAEILAIIEYSGGNSPHNTAFCYAEATEALAGIEPPPRAKYIRVLLAEAERLHNHLLSFSVRFRDRGIDTLFRKILSDREFFLAAVCELSGSRIIYGVNTLGGVNRDVSVQALMNLSRTVDDLDRRLKQYQKNNGEGEKHPPERKMFNPRRIFNNYLHTEETGEAVRVFDARKNFPYSAYADMSFIAARHEQDHPQSLLTEMRESLRIIRFILDNLPEGGLAVDFLTRIPAGESLSLCQAASGAFAVYIRSDGTDKPPKINLFPCTLYSIAKQNPIL